MCVRCMRILTKVQGHLLVHIISKLHHHASHHASGQGRRDCKAVRGACAGSPGGSRLSNLQGKAFDAAPGSPLRRGASSITVGPISRQGTPSKVGSRSQSRKQPSCAADMPMLLHTCQSNENQTSDHETATSEIPSKSIEWLRLILNFSCAGGCLHHRLRPE